jgi:hypothetical protein
MAKKSGKGKSGGTQKGGGGIRVPAWVMLPVGLGVGWAVGDVLGAILGGVIGFFLWRSRA